MTPQELKNSILQLAIQGKLVEQRPEEGTAAELLEKILAAKNAEGAKVGARVPRDRKGRAVAWRAPIPDDEKPFDIPESWEWYRIGDLFNIVNGFTPLKRNLEFWSNGDIPWFTIEDVRRQGRFIYSTEKFITQKALTKNTERVVPPDTVLLCCTASVGEYAYTKIPLTTNQQFNAFVVKKDYQNYIYPLYVFEYVKTLKNNLIDRAGKTTFNFVSVGKLSKMLIPLPPLAEQKRIVAKIEELMPLVDRYEKAWSRLEDFNKRFPIDMQKSLLQMAIQGKLVEQRAEEGTGEELYRQIQVERERLIRNGAVKAEKPFDPISDDDKPFKIPENWTWVRFGNLGRYKKGPFGSALTKSIFVTKGANSVKVYEQKNAIQKDATLGEYYIRRDYFETKMSGFEVHSGDVIVSCAGTIGETYVLPEGIEQGIINQALMRMKIFVPMYVPYFLMFFDVVLKQSARANSKGSAIKNIPPFEILKNYLVPLPPLAEQKRIVAKIEELLPLIDRYEKAWSKFDFKR